MALALQSALWPWITPYVWFLFFPAVFFSARFGGFRGGLASTALSAAIVWFVFIPPRFSFLLETPTHLYSVGIFVAMGYLFSESQEHLRRAQLRSQEALSEARAAQEKVTQLYQKTRELDELKTQFFANVSHELRTPLTLILGPVRKLLAEGDLEPAERQDLEVVERNARVLYRHVSDLLDVARLEAGRMDLHRTAADLTLATRAMASNFDSLARERGIRFELTTPESLPARVDVAKVQRILLNLLSNAFKFTPREGSIAVRLRFENGSAVLEVEDSGPGVPPDLREVIFEPFRQGDGSAARGHGGTGLGLAIVREFAELHGGEVAVSDAPGGGARFSARLPIESDEPLPAGAEASELDPQLRIQALEELQTAAPRPRAVPHGEAPLILVVDDNLDMNAYVARELAGRYRVASAFDGKEGLEQARALRPMLILADVMMPGLTGDAMALALREHDETREIPILMLTAKEDEALRLKLLQAGVQEYISKPFVMEELLARVDGIVHERRLAAERLNESETRFQATFEQAAVGIAHVAPDGRWLRVNRRLCDLLGYGQHELLGMTVQEITHPEDLPGSIESTQRLLSGEIANFSIEKRYLRKDGGIAWSNLTVALARKDDGTPAYLISVIEDIARRKLAEEEIRSLNAELEDRVEKRTAELSAANRELDAFAYAVSHDLRAPLRAMSGFSQILLEDCGDRLDLRARTLLDKVTAASRKMGELIDGLLVLSRSGRAELRHQRVDLSALAGEVREELERSEPERSVEWWIEPSLAVTGDAGLLGVALRNLLGNAWKYTGRCAAPQIRLFSESSDGFTWVCVADNGAGFEMAYAARLFEPFQRLHRQDEFTGLGIGLATVKRIVHRHGGEIRADSVPGRGATFRFHVGESRLGQAPGSPMTS